jgi:hypothetical protein
MEEPELAFAPVMLPVLVPKVHAKVLDILDVRLMLGLVPLQVLTVVAFVTAGEGFTVTTTLKVVGLVQPFAERVYT